MNKRKIIPFLAFILSSLLLTAQTEDNKFALDLNVIANEYHGDYGYGIWRTGNTVYPAGGLGLSYYLNPSFNVGLSGSYGSYGFIRDAANRFSVNKFDADLHLDYKFNNGYILKKTVNYLHSLP